MPEPDETFKVIDRRRRGGGEEAAPSVDATPREQRPEPPVRPAGPSAEEPPLERSLEGLFLMLATSAMVALGEAPDPVTGEAHADPGHAAELVDLLVLLRERTEGNLTAPESQLLGELIYDLQLRYVRATRRSG